MGYYTRFNLEVEGKEKDNLNNLQPPTSPVIAALMLINPEYYAGEDGPIYWSEILQGIERTKWYSYKDDMIKVSQVFRGSLFILTMDGERPDDFTRAYFLNGNYESVNGAVTYPEPQLVKLPSNPAKRDSKKNPVELVHLQKYDKPDGTGLCNAIGKTMSHHEIKRGKITCPGCLLEMFNPHTGV